MKLSAWFFAIAWACAGPGCSASSSPIPSGSPPIGFTFESTAGSFASFGWSGTFHDVEEPLGTPFGVKTTDCPGGTDGVCRFEGPADPVSKVNRRRCLFRMSTTCNTDGDCPLDSGNPTACVYIYDAPVTTPLPSSDKRLGACAWSYIPIAASGQPPTVSGTLNLASGDLNLENLTILLPLNANPMGFFGACAECVGDPTPNDGVKGGTCMRTTHYDKNNGHFDDGPDIGRPCDVNRYGTLPGYEGSYSMDCSPTVISGRGRPTQFGGSFKSLGFQVSLTEQRPACSGPTFNGMSDKCFCAMCPDGVTPCTSDDACGGQRCGQLPADCNPNPFPLTDTLAANTDFDTKFLPMQCRGYPNDPTKFAVAANSCVNKQCVWNPDTGLGSCMSKLTGSIVGCYPSLLGDSIFAPGRTEVDRHLGTVYHADTASASCIGAGGSALVNSQLGLPGLLFQKRNFQVIPQYAEEQR